MDRSKTARRGARAGFTLLELLAVILIVGILATVLITQLGGAQDSAKASMTRTFLAELETLVKEYELEHGDYPPSSFTPDQGVSNDGTNVGIEALVVALYSEGWNAGGHEIREEKLGNTDGDRSGRTLTDFPNKKLFEFVDLWENPIAYIHHRDYEAEGRAYTVVDELGESFLDVPKAYKNALIGRYHRHASFQLISAGPSGRFGTSDDITNFKRERQEE